MTTIISIFCGAALFFWLADCIDKDAKEATKKRIHKIVESYDAAPDKSTLTYEDLMEETNSHE